MTDKLHARRLYLAIEPEPLNLTGRLLLGAAWAVGVVGLVAWIGALLWLGYAVGRLVAELLR